MSSSRRRSMLVFLAGAAVLMTAFFLLASLGGPNSQGSPGAAPVKNVTFYYQQVPDDPGLGSSFFGNAGIVVTNSQFSSGASDTVQNAAERNAVAQIHATGAKAYRYVNFYWYPAGKEYQDINISQHMDWAFCRSGTTPSKGKRTSGTTQWYFIDLNERAAQNAASDFLRRVYEKWGYDGVMIDRGAAALQGGKDPEGNYIWHRQSTCTQDAVNSEESFADAYRRIVKQAKAVGLETMLNYGTSPFRRSVPLRPDPSSSACQNRDWDNCPTLSDIWSSLDYVLDENPSRTGDLWLREWSESFWGENDSAHSGQVIGLVKVKDPALESAPPGGSTAFKNEAYFKWASAKLANQPLAINTGDDFCGGYEVPHCWRHGTRKELTQLQLGKPQGTTSWRVNCNSNSEVECVHIRRYSKGIVVVNASNQTKATGPVSLNLSSCRKLFNLYANQYLAGGGCHSSINRSIPAQSGRVYRYDT